MELMRKISSVARWDGTNVVDRDDQFICGDALGDLKTSHNTLSVWKVDDETDIKDAVVALTLSRDRVDKVFGICLDSEVLKEKEIDISEEKGEAPGIGEDVLKKHRDLVEIDYWRVGYLAEYMMKIAKENGFQIKYTAKMVKDLMEQYKNLGKLNLDDMKDSLKKDLHWI